MTSQTGEHMILNISRSKGNQTMKFGQLTEYNMRNIFFEKLFTKCGGEAIPRPFSQISNFIAWFPLLREILGTMCIVIIC